MLNVQDLSVRFDENTVVDHVSFEIKKGEKVSIVGESGSGKTMIALAIAGLLAESATSDGSVVFDNTNLLELQRSKRRKYQGNRISMVFQEPMTSLNPLMKVGEQIDEVLMLHSDKNKRERKEAVYKVLEELEFSNIELIYHKYPHELSGGMRQRIVLAMALVCKPDLIIADEPTTALDVDTQEQILLLLDKVNKKSGCSILFISHDLNIVRNLCDRVLVMHHGTMVEQGTVHDIFEHPKDSYTKKLLEASVIQKAKREFDSSHENILEVKNLSVYYKERTRKLRNKTYLNYVLKNISFDMKKGEILGLVGKSGIGKSSISKVILGLHKGYTGTVTHYSKKPQMIFQDPYSSLNPVKKVSWILEEPLKIQGGISKAERKQRVREMLQKVGLDVTYGDRRPRELSGGQRQRVSIALSLILGSEFIIADEPVSALDITIQAQIIDLLLQLQRDFNLSILLISHDKSIIEKVCDRVISI